MLVLAVAALAGAPPPGKGKPGRPGKALPTSSTARAGKQYGKTKVTLCHKGKKTITVGAPAAEGAPAPRRQARALPVSVS